MYLAHCPLCAAGTGLVAFGASYFGIDDAIVGVWLGAFAISLALITAKAIKKKFIPVQKFFVVSIIFLTSFLPGAIFFEHYLPLYIHLLGSYGGIFNRMYLVKRYILGGFLGALIVLIAPSLNSFLVFLRKGKKVPFQKLILTFVLLFVLSLIFYFWL